MHNIIIHNFTKQTLKLQIYNTFRPSLPHLQGVHKGYECIERRFYLTFRHREVLNIGQAFSYSPENAFYIFIQQIYFIF